jgi:beta-glucosidase
MRAAPRASRGLEGYSHGQRWTFAPMLDHPFDPRWGRVVETSRRIAAGVGDYGVATVQGFHRSLAGLPGSPAPADFGVASCLKHYLGYGASQGGKDYAYVDLSERAIREFHLPPFIAALQAGAPSVMPAFTTGSGAVPMSANKHLLQDGCAANSASTACWSPTTRASPRCACTARRPTISMPRCRRCATAP